MPTPLPSLSADTLLLCIDLQPPFVDAVADGAAILRRSEFAVATATGLGLPVAFTEQVPAKLGPTAASLRALAPSAPAWSKTAFSAFADTRIREILLREQPVRHLLLCGVETPICVYQTAVDALAENVQVTLLVDCLGARRPEDARACLSALARHGAHVLPAETVFYALLHDTSHPFFRDFTRLVKTHHSGCASPAGSAPTRG